MCSNQQSSKHILTFCDSLVLSERVLRVDSPTIIAPSNERPPWGMRSPSFSVTHTHTRTQMNKSKKKYLFWLLKGLNSQSAKKNSMISRMTLNLFGWKLMNQKYCTTFVVNEWGSFKMFSYICQTNQQNWQQESH